MKLTLAGLTSTRKGGRQPACAEKRSDTPCQTVFPVNYRKQTTEPSPARHKKCRAGARLATGKTLSSRRPEVRAEGSAAAFDSAFASAPARPRANSNRYAFRSGIAASLLSSSKVPNLIDTKREAPWHSPITTQPKFLIVTPAIRIAANSLPHNKNSISNRHKTTASSKPRRNPANSRSRKDALYT
jgi:hypothetical protein